MVWNGGASRPRTPDARDLRIRPSREPPELVPESPVQSWGRGAVAPAPARRLPGAALPWSSLRRRDAALASLRTLCRFFCNLCRENLHFHRPRNSTSRMNNVSSGNLGLLTSTYVGQLLCARLAQRMRYPSPDRS